MADSAYLDIRRALENRLADTSGIIDIAWENGVYTPTTGTPFIRTIFLPTYKKPRSIGPNYVEYYRGAFKVNLHYPVKEGPGATDAMANTVLNRFKPSTDLTFNVTTLTIESSERSVSYTTDAWFVTQLNVYWFAYS